jgi:hypothetical protein
VIQLALDVRHRRSSNDTDSKVVSNKKFKKKEVIFLMKIYFKAN